MRLGVKEFLVIIFTTLTNQVFSQPRLDLDCFVVGLIDDPRKKLIKEEKMDWELIEEFPPPDFEFMDFIDSLIRVENSWNQDKVKITASRILSKNDGISYMYYSKVIAERTNKYYKFKFNHEWDLNWRKMYIGEVNLSCFKTSNQRVSFLTGVFFNFGEHAGDVYKYTIRRNKTKFSLILKSLKALDCEIVNTNVSTWSHSDSNQSHIENQTVEFKPSGELADALRGVHDLKDRIENKRKVFYNSLN